MNHIVTILFIIAVSFLSFASGALLTYHQQFPYTFIYRMTMAGAAWYDTNINELDETTPIKGTLGTKDRYNIRTQWELSNYKKEYASDEVIAVCPEKSPSIHLISAQGKLLHKWEVPENYRSSGQKVLSLHRGFHLYENGDVIIIFQTDSAGEKSRISRLDKDSNVLWEIGDWFHHDIEINDDGNIVTLQVTNTAQSIPRVPSIKTPFMHDHLVTISPNGKILSKVSLVEAFLDTPYEEFLKYLHVKSVKGDITHYNNISILSAEMAPAFPHLHVGDILLSSRHMSTIMVLNPETQKIVWAKRGVWRLQHDPEFMENGNIMLFDNSGLKHKKRKEDAISKRSRIIEIDGKTGKLLHSYGDNNELKFYSSTAGNQQILGNGNILINASEQSRIIEYSKKYGIVRELKNTTFGKNYCMSSFPIEQLSQFLTQVSGERK